MKLYYKDMDTINADKYVHVCASNGLALLELVTV